MKNTILLLAFAGIIISIFSCKKDSITNDPGSNLTGLTSISGAVVNWTLGSKTIKLRVTGWQGNTSTIAAVSSISSNGSFSFNNLPTLSNTDIDLVTFPNDSNCSGNITINPNGLKAGSAYINVYSATDSAIGRLEMASALNFHYGDIKLYHYYFSSAGSISGNYNCNLSGTQLEESVNVNFPAHWYYLVARYDSLGYNHYKYTVNNTVPSGLNWYFYSNPFDDKRTGNYDKGFIK